MFYLNIKNLQEFVNLRRTTIMKFMIYPNCLGWCFCSEFSHSALSFVCWQPALVGVVYGFRYYHYPTGTTEALVQPEARPEALSQTGGATEGVPARLEALVQLEHREA